jgi:hypothetical protein
VCDQAPPEEASPFLVTDSSGITIHKEPPKHW